MFDPSVCLSLCQPVCLLTTKGTFLLLFFTFLFVVVRLCDGRKQKLTPECGCDHAYRRTMVAMLITNLVYKPETLNKKWESGSGSGRRVAGRSNWSRFRWMNTRTGDKLVSMKQYLSDDTLLFFLLEEQNVFNDMCEFFSVAMKIKSCFLVLNASEVNLLLLYTFTEKTI